MNYTLFLALIVSSFSSSAKAQVIDHDKLMESIRSQSGSIDLSRSGGKLDGTLSLLKKKQSSALGLRAQSQNLSFDQDEAGAGVEFSAPIARPDGKVMVTAYPVPGQPIANLISALVALKFEVVAKSNWAVEGYIAPDALQAAEAISSLASLNAVITTTHAGQFLTEGDALMKTDWVRTNTRLTGRGVNVGVISDSFDCLGGANNDILSGDILPSFVVVKEATCGTTLDEGRAMMQIIHDVAPEAKQLFHTGLGGALSGSVALKELVQAGAKVVVDDMAYLGDPWFQETALTEAIKENVKSNDIVYVTAAGNLGPDYSYGAPFVSSGSQPLAGLGPWHRFGRDPGDNTNVALVRVPPATRSVFILQWDQPWKVNGSTRGPTSDLSMILASPFGQVLGVSQANNPVTGTAIESITVNNPSLTTPLDLLIAVSLVSGPPPSRLQLFLTNRTVFRQANIKSYNASVFGQANSPFAITAGAAIRNNIWPPVIEAFSSIGGTNTRYDFQGNDQAVGVPLKPDIIGPNDSANSFFGTDSDGDGIPNFRGTSAAAPHIAGVAALFRQAYPAARFDYIRDSMTATAIDMDDPRTPVVETGFDFRTGYGFVDAQAAFMYLAQRNKPPATNIHKTLVKFRLNNDIQHYSASISDDGLPVHKSYWLQHKWEIEHSGGPDAYEVISTSASNISIRFKAKGSYVITLKANDGQLSSSDKLYVVTY